MIGTHQTLSKRYTYSDNIDILLLLLLWDNAADCQLLAFVRGIGGLRAGSLIFHGQPLLQ